MSLQNLQGTAVRHGNQIEVNLIGRLSNSCQTAAISKAVPGAGQTGQVHITTGVKPGGHFCLMVLMPWAETTLYADKNDTEVEVFVDGKSTLTIPVTGKPDQYEVYRNLNGEGCIIVPAGSAVPAIYSHAFGPASRADCEKYVADNCGAQPPNNSMETPNKVVVDLEGLNLKKEELDKIGAAVQSAVLKELGTFGGTQPANLGVLQGLRDPRWVGLIIRDLSAFNVDNARIDEIRSKAGL